MTCTTFTRTSEWGEESQPCASPPERPTQNGHSLLPSGWQGELSSLRSAQEVVVEEVRVQQGLQDAAEVHDPVVNVILFRVCPVDPVEDVQGPVRAHEKDVVAGQIFHLAVALQHDELRQYGDRFQVNAERPERLNEFELRETVLENVRQHADRRARGDGELPVQEGVLCFVVGRFDWLLVLDGVDDHGGRQDVHDLHHRVVDGVKMSEKVQVPRDEDEQKKLVSSYGNAYTRPGQREWGRVSGRPRIS